MDSKQRAEHSVLVGGATTFHSYNMMRQLDVLPKAGRILLFQHRDLLHSGDDVVVWREIHNEDRLAVRAREQQDRRAEQDTSLGGRPGGSNREVGGRVGGGDEVRLLHVNSSI